MSYPVSYRKGAQSYAAARPRPNGTGNQSPPVPANDNWKGPSRPPAGPPPQPANDNVKANYQRLQNAVASIRGPAAMVSRRMNLYVSAAQYALDAYELWSQMQLEALNLARFQSYNKTGYQLIEGCGNDGTNVTDWAWGPACEVQWYNPDWMTWAGGRPFHVITYTPTGVVHPVFGYPQVKQENVYRKIDWNPEIPDFVQNQPGVWQAPMPSPWLNPVPHPWTDPLHWSPGSPTPVPKPYPYPAIPYRTPDPLASPSHGSERGHSRWPMPTPDGRPAPGRRPEYPGSSNPGRQPPGPGEKERKMRATSAAGAVGGAIIRAAQKGGHAASEVADAIDVFWDALPDSKKPKGSNKWGAARKAAHVYKHANSLNLNDLILGLAKNHVEDMVVGRANKRVNKYLRDQAARYTRNPLGIVRGGAF